MTNAKNIIDAGYAALAEAGIRVWESKDGAVRRAYDPRKRGGYITLSEATCGGRDICWVEKSGASGAFAAEAREALQAAGLTV